jgi:serine/threonine-protein kinase
MALKPRQNFGKYRVLRRLASGGFATVYAAHDTVEGIDVALKVPHEHIVARGSLKDFKREVRLSAQLDHPNILPIKTAGEIEGQFVIVTPLGKETLRDRYHRRLTSVMILSIVEQMLEALAHAHDHRIAHCDVKPENIILFADGRVRLADFGIARIALRTLRASGSGTVGYMAPEQAMGQPSVKSDVFSAGLVIARLAGGVLPEWPFKWPFTEHHRMLRRFSPEFLGFLRRAVHIHGSRRYPNARLMLEAFHRVLPRALAHSHPTSSPSTRSITKTKSAPKKARSTKTDWKSVRIRQFKREYGKALGAKLTCQRCKNPVSEPMITCPWCGASRKILRPPTESPARCVRCHRGLKGDWRFCPWCFGAAVGPSTKRQLRDKRYIQACNNPACTRKELLPFMRYCPWCRTRVTRLWKIPGSTKKCKKGHSPMLPDYWAHCPWCPAKVAQNSR